MERRLLWRDKLAALPTREMLGHERLLSVVLCEELWGSYSILSMKVGPGSRVIGKPIGTLEWTVDMGSVDEVGDELKALAKAANLLQHERWAMMEAARAAVWGEEQAQADVWTA